MNFLSRLIKWNNGRLHNAQKNLAQTLGVSSATVSQWATRKRTPSEKLRRKLSKEFKISIDDIDKMFERERTAFRGVAEKEFEYRTSSTPTYHHIPVMGVITGEFFRCETQEAGPLEVMPFHMAGYQGTKMYALRISGNHMEPVARNGWYVFIAQTKSVHNGELAIIRLQNGDCTIKRVYYSKESIELRPDNPKHKTLTFSPTDSNFEIIGWVVMIGKKT
jgi:SOS-response transcriptional repressor LexA